MRIALDWTALQRGAGIGGVARYSSQLAAALAREFPEDELVLVSDQPFEMPSLGPNVLVGQGPRNALERRWWTFGLQRELRRQRADVFHGTNFAVPVPAAVPAVLTIHDLSPWAEGDWVDDNWRARTARVRKRVPWMIRTGAARHIITPCEAVRNEVIRRFHADPRRVTAIPQAAAEHFRPTPGAPHERPYFLFVGMLEARKNIAALGNAWSALRARFDVDLVIAGPRREEAPAIDLRPGIILPGEVAESQLAAWYSGAIALVYPSHYEGFGLPVLEAMQCGTPVIVSRDPALMETAGDAGLSTDNIYDAMCALLENRLLRPDLSARSLARAALFTWERTARCTHDIYRGMLGQ